jgi:hypothetical protein
MSPTSSVQRHALPCAPDPYLSTTSDPEELSFQASAIRLTPVGSPHSRPGSSPHAIDPTVQPSYLDLNTCTSPLSERVFIKPEDIELGNPSRWRDDSYSSHKSEASATVNPIWSSPMAPSAFPWHGMSSENPNSSSTLTGLESHGNHVPTVHNVEPSRFAPSVQESDVLNSGETRGRSPVIKFTKFSRGDSPNERNIHQKRISQSSGHLLVDPDESGDDHDGRSTSPAPLKRSNDGTWPEDSSKHHPSGIEPGSRDDQYVPSPNDIHLHRVKEERDGDIKSWSVCVSEANSDAGGSPRPPRPRLHVPRRVRARSTGDNPLAREDYFTLNSHTGDRSYPGPGILVYESSDSLSEDEESIGTYSDETSAEVDDPERYDRSTPEVYSSFSPTKADESIRLYPWHDPPRDPTPRSHAMQPDSSTDAMIAFERRVRDLETASLAATVDNNSIFNVTTSLENFSLDSRDQPRKRTSLLRRPFLQASSMLKRQASDLSIGHGSTYPGLQRDTEDPQVKQSHSPRNPFSNRRHSRSPSLSNALMAMTSQIASVGGSQPVRAVPPAPSPPERSSTKLHQFTGRGRSRSEIPRPSSPGLINLMTAHGGPPVPNISSPRASHEAAQTPTSTLLDPNTGGPEDEHDIDMSDMKGVAMDFPAIQSLPVPTFEGFRSQIMQMNPRLEPALIHRLANEQDRRYRLLVGLQQNHAHAAANRSCKSADFCFAQGGQESLLQDPTASAETEAAQIQFRVSNFTDGHEQVYAIGEDAGTAAQFPPGVPSPPVKRLPARFECPICFQVKSFKKPSDWSKHVQEDVQPFTCTFPNCNEPKSFKRKADWVRHENERHRHLEWWTCAFHECNHICYRKDNFVQHLVREHKMPEPNNKKKGSTTEERPSSRREQDLERLWQMVEECRHETDRSPQSEPCRFCGNVCNEWRKLSVHLGKHLEQLAMPVLRLSKPSAPIPVVPVNNLVGRSATPLAPYSTHETSLQPQYAPPNVSNPLNPLDYSISGTELSMEPDSMSEESLDYRYLGFQGPHPAQEQAQTQTHPLHQNSTYPPLFNAVPRPSSPELSAIHSYPVPQFRVFPADYYQPVEANIPYTATYSSG